MFLPLIVVIILIGLCATLIAWYYSREFEKVRYEYLGSSQSGASGRADDVYLALVRPLRTRRLIALAIAMAATCAAVALVTLHNV